MPNVLLPFRRGGRKQRRCNQAACGQCVAILRSGSQLTPNPSVDSTRFTHQDEAIERPNPFYPQAFHPDRGLSIVSITEGKRIPSGASQLVCREWLGAVLGSLSSGRHKHPCCLSGSTVVIGPISWTRGSLSRSWVLPRHPLFPPPLVEITRTSPGKSSHQNLFRRNTLFRLINFSL